MAQYVAATAEKVFVYGKFNSAPPHASVGEPVAIEILREFGPQEFIGKLYVQRGTSWIPVTPESTSLLNWYNDFQDKKEVYFEMRGSGRWEIAWFRSESSVRDPNPYLAVALKQKVTETSNVASPTR